MNAQWQGLSKNLGVWVGSFANYSTEGRLVDEVPSELTLTLSQDEQSIGLCLNRFPANQPTKTIEMNFRYPGPGAQIPFFESGAFSQGALQYSSFSRFGAELAMIWGDRRLRIVQNYPMGANWSGLTLICETRAGEKPSPQLQIDDLLGEWTGEAQTRFADLSSPASFQSHLTVEAHGCQLRQTLSFGTQQLQSVGEISGNSIEFSQGQQPTRLLLLPGGGSSLCPPQIVSGQPFFLEAGWLIQPNLRQRLIRRYRPNGEWESLTLVTERKCSAGAK